MKKMKSKFFREIRKYLIIHWSLELASIFRTYDYSQPWFILGMNENEHFVLFILLIELMTMCRLC